MHYTRIILPYRVKENVLALGAQSKSAFCFAKGDTAYLPEPGGDLSELWNFKGFEKKIKGLGKKLNIKPCIIACDMHPEYISTKYAQEWLKVQGLRLKGIQHHEAHVASCMADNRLKGRVIGVAFDGTGFGSDANIWGGEFFIGGIKGFERIAHLKYVPMPGGEACIREPWRMAFSYLYSIYGKKCMPIGWNSPFRVKNKQPKGWVPEVFEQMIDKKINSPLTSSVGRLFDAVSALTGICGFAAYEGEAAIRLEEIMVAQGSRLKAQGKYDFKYKDEDGIVIIDWEPVIKDIVRDLKYEVDKAEISLKFHNAICNMIKETCKLLRKRYKIHKVCLSGGVFQNRYLKNHIRPILEKQGFEVYLHNRVPAHDGGIALGQAVLAGSLNKYTL